MSKLTVDFSEVESFEPLPKGEYLAVIEEAKVVHPASEDKYPYINLKLDVTEDGEYKGRKLWVIWSLSPKALFRMKNDLDNLGIVVDEIDIDFDEDTDMVTSPELVGVPVVATVSMRTYEGREQNQVDVLRSPDGAQPVGAKTTGTKAAAKKAPARKFK